MVRIIIIILTSCLWNYSFAQEYHITIFGTNLLVPKELRNCCEKQLTSYYGAYQLGDKVYDAAATSINDRIRNLNSEFCYTNAYFFKDYVGNIELIVDVVERKDSLERLNFRKIDQKPVVAPLELLKKWNEYEELSFTLYQKGEINDMSCPVVHCIWSFNHEKLAPYLEFFNKEAQLNSDALGATLHHDPDENHRAAAAFLLVHSGMSDVQLLDSLYPAIRDPSSLVRNNVLRVIYYIAKKHPEFNYDYKVIVDALSYPSFTDRNKALVVLRSLPISSMDRELQKRMVIILFEILEKKDAHNYRNAHTVLKNLSGMNYSVDDLELWKQWGQNEFSLDN